jgi:hypothetical protein
MPDYRVEGTSLVRWSLLVEAGSESEASAVAVRTAGYLCDLRQDEALRDVRHEIVCLRKLIEDQAEDRAHHRAAAQMGDE